MPSESHKKGGRFQAVPSRVPHQAIQSRVSIKGVAPRDTNHGVTQRASLTRSSLQREISRVENPGGPCSKAKQGVPSSGYPQGDPPLETESRVSTSGFPSRGSKTGVPLGVRNMGSPPGGPLQGVEGGP